MTAKRVIAIAKKEFIQIVRDPRSLGLAIMVPITLIVIFGFALSLDVQNVPTAIWDQDNSQISQNFLLNFKNSKYFKIIGYYDNYRDLQRLIDKGTCLMAIVVPKDFSAKLTSNQQAPLQLLLDGSDSNTAQIASGYVRSVVTRYNTAVIIQAMQHSGYVSNVPIEMEQRVWFNQDFQSKYFVIPGIIAMIMMIIAGLLTSLTIVREWERGTMEQLVSTPVKGLELIIGKFIPYFVIGLIDLFVTIFLGKYLFGVPIRGSFPLLLGLSCIFLTGALMLGIYISTVSKSQLLASQMAILTSFLPSLLLSGFTYEIFNMPPAVQLITYLVPARYFIVILRGIYLKSVGLGVLWPEAVSLIIFSLITIGLATRRFKKKIPVN